MNNKILSKVLNFTKEHSPELLIATGVVGMSASTILAVKATPKALQLMEDKKSELGVTYLTKKETVESTWKQYAPSAGLYAVSAACIILGTTKNLKRNTALATVYALSESTLKEYQKKTKEIVGKEKAEEIDKAVAKAHIKETPVFVEGNDSSCVTYTGNGNQLIFDTLSGRYFRSSRNAIDASVNQINKQLMNEYTMTANDFYNELNIPAIGAGNYIGWKSDGDHMEIRYDSDIDANGESYLVLTYSNRPIALKGYYGHM